MIPPTKRAETLLRKASKVWFSEYELDGKVFCYYEIPYTRMTHWAFDLTPEEIAWIASEKLKGRWQ